MRLLVKRALNYLLQHLFCWIVCGLECVKLHVLRIGGEVDNLATTINDDDGGDEGGDEGDDEGDDVGDDDVRGDAP